MSKEIDNLDNRRNKPVAAEGSKSLQEYSHTDEIYQSHFEEQEFDIREYLDVILRRKWVIISFFSIVLIATIVGTLISRPIYRATTKVEIKLENPNIIKFEDIFEVEKRAEEFFETQRIIIKSESLAKRIIDEHELGSHPEFTGEGTQIFNPISYAKSFIGGIIYPLRNIDPENKIAIKSNEIDKIVKQFLNRINVEPIGESRIVSISFDSHYRQQAAMIANSIADNYIEWTLDKKLEASKEGRSFLKKQLEQAQINLEKSEEALNKFAKSNSIISLEERMNLTYHKFAELNDALTKASRERLEKESLYEYAKNGDIANISLIVNDPYIQRLNSELSSLEAQYSKLNATFKPDYPKVKEIGAQISELKEKVKQAENRLVNSIKSDYEASLKKEKVLESSFNAQRDQTSELNEKAIQYKIIQREVDTNKSIYESLLLRLRETEVSAGIEASNIQIIDSASIPLIPYKPRLSYNMMIAIVVGMLGGVGIALLLDHLDNTVKTQEEIRERLKLPVLGGILEIEPSKNSYEVVEKTFHLQPNSLFAEAFRTIRISILLSSPGRPPRSILVTSSLPAEGKTTVSTNLAYSFAQHGSKVILIDVDFRRPRIKHIFNQHGLGLTNYLTGNASLENIIQKNDTSTFDVITVGAIPANPSELLGSSIMKKLFENLYDRYDTIIVDGPPVLNFSDTLIVSNLVDGTVVVASSESTPKKDLVEVVSKLKRFNAKVLGVILNRVREGSNYYYYNKYSAYYSKELNDSFKEKKKIKKASN